MFFFSDETTTGKPGKLVYRNLEREQKRVLSTVLTQLVQLIIVQYLRAAAVTFRYLLVGIMIKKVHNRVV